MYMQACVCFTHSSLQLLSVLLVEVAQAGFMHLPLLPQRILHPVADVISQGLQITLHVTDTSVTVNYHKW